MCDCDVDLALNHLLHGVADDNKRGSGTKFSLNRRSLLTAAGTGLLASTLPGTFGSGKAANETPGKFRVGFIAEPAHGLHFLAREKGYFREQGLDVELFQFKSAGEGVIALKAGQLDIGTFGSAAPLLFISQGVEFTIFGGMMIGGQAILTRPERLSELKTLENYRGKKVALVKLSTGDVVFRLALKKQALTRPRISPGSNFLLLARWWKPFSKVKSMQGSCFRRISRWLKNGDWPSRTTSPTSIPITLVAA